MYQRKTPRMRRVESTLGRPLEEDIRMRPGSPNDLAVRYDVDPRTIYAWMLRLGFTTRIETRVVPLEEAR